MASPTAQTDAIRSAVTSVSTCTPAISASLKELLQGRRDDNDEPSKPPVRSARQNTQTSAKTKPAIKTKKPVKSAGDACQDVNNLSPKEKAILATHVINATLKALGDAAKTPQASNATRSPAKHDVAKSAARARLRRSASVPMTPLQPRSLNRVDTSPATTKVSVVPSTAASTGCLAIVECARVAFATLRGLQASGAITLPELQLESGMSTLVARLIALKLFEHAIKELRILKRRLECMVAGNGDTKTTISTKGANAPAKTLSDLLDYPVGDYPRPVLGFIITTQLQTLRIIYELNKTTHLSTALQFLQSSNPRSPMNLLLSCVQSGKSECVKTARQLESLSQILLSLTPSLASKDDNVALEPRLSPSPEISLEVQTLGLTARLESWNISDHKGDIDKEILLPLSRCLAAFSRRTSSEHNSKLVDAFMHIWDKLGKLKSQASQSSNGSLSTIYQLLAKGFQESGNPKEAKKWTSKWKGLINEDSESAAKCCAAAAQLLALSLQDSSDVDESLVAQVLDGMQGPLSGSVAELDDLLISLSFLRKVVFKIIVKEPTGKAEQEPHRCRDALEKLITQLPRFSLRWLGKPPVSNSTTKDLLRFEQRRQLLSKHLRQILDSALLLTKTLIDEHRFTWETIDPMLQDGLALLEYMGDMGQSFESNPSASYHVKISHLYYQQHLALRHSAATEIDSTSLRALKRSIDSVKQREEPEQARAQLLKKWESFVELCKASGRKDDAIDALRSIRDNLVRCDTVQAITASLSSQPIRSAWKISPEAEFLSRAICNLAKLERKPNDWTWLLFGEDKATALEHDLNFILTNNNNGQQKVDMSDPTVVNLLQFYSVEQYPIRRLRSLLIVLAASIDSQDQLERLRTETDTVLEKIENRCFGNDTRLEPYVPHLRHSVSCILGMTCGEFDSSNIREAVSAWKSIAAGCKAASQLTKHVDDPQQLLQILQSLADFMRMKGQQSLLTEIVELSTMISQLTIDANIESHMVQSSSLSLHYLSLGQSTKAEGILQSLMSTDKIALSQISSDVMSNFHLSAAEYYLAVGKFDEAEKHLEDARKAGAITTQSRRKHYQLNRKISIAHASFLTSTLYLERGENHRALKLAKTAVRTLFHDWSQLEQNRASMIDITVGDLSQTDASEGDSGLDNSRMSDFELARAHTGPAYWALVCPLYRFTCQLSSTYEHLGMYQETLYYAEQAQKIAKGMGSLGHLNQATTYLASVALIADNTTKSLDLIAEIKPTLMSSEPTLQAVTTLCKAASICQEVGETEDEGQFLSSAESMLEGLSGGIVNKLGNTLRPKSIQESSKETAPPKSRGRVPRVAKPTPTSKKAATKKTAVKETNSVVEIVTHTSVEDLQLKSLRASVLLSRSLAFIKRQDWAAAISALQSAAQLSSLTSDLSHEHLLLGISLMGQSLTQMGNNSIFSFIQDSTLSFPSVALAARDKSPHGGRASPTKKPRATQQDTQGFVEKLHDAQEHLLEAHAIAARNGNGFLVHRIAAALQNVLVLLSNTSPSVVRASHPAYATCSIELARNLTWRRERKANRCDAAKEDRAAWPMILDSPDSSRRTSLGFSIDMNRFQRDYVDIIPAAWNVVSLSLNETKNDLCVTKLKAGSSPFALRLPLKRACSRDAGNDVFDFAQGRSELLELIQLANQTCHDARDLSQKGAKSAWWAEREELDERLKQLLETIELTWLGGFKGIFSPHHRRSDLLARFQKTFQIILEKHLPSRRQVRGRKTKKPTTKVNLDPRILELFVGLGDVMAAEGDLDEPLTDLLYFVVDVLQFHGEANAYDEVDFDGMIIDTTNALHAYHSAVKEAAKKDQQSGTHTILILDKSLHVFPWESLPCLQGVAVSRVPSLDYLRRAILEAKAPPTSSSSSQETTESDLEEDTTTTSTSTSTSTSTPPSRPGHHVSINSGTYILNPSADLINTQATFGRALSTLPPSWNSIEARAPSEDEFASALAEKDILLYFGHGSGAQYIRGRTVRQLQQPQHPDPTPTPKNGNVNGNVSGKGDGGKEGCRAVALLMGCSSASLTHVGDAFEPYGPVRDYMLSGSPAVVGTLWDVTDRDIDRFAGNVFEDWGLFPKGTFSATEEKSGSRRGKGKGKTPRKRTAARGEVEGEVGGQGMSLVEAVAKARTEACRFRYLTAAAVCVYGIPVYVAT
ncbi:peptidase family C50-domain-containing protein [Nemania sp. FL0916]|nr:peptidase family C50-domain-containing protein [Nemania sp. FL0916]